jgi:uncharacterized membrane protein
MKRIKRLLQQPEFSVVLFVVGLILFIRPLLAMSVSAPSHTVLLSIFLPWIFIIVLLMLVNQSLARLTSFMDAPETSSADLSAEDENLQADNKEVHDA